MKRKISIVIVDSGVNSLHPKILNHIDGYSVKEVNGEYVVDNNCDDEFGHGTAIYGIINRHCPEANIIPIKIFKNDRDMADVNLLIYALKFIDEKINCDIVNMSVGVSILKEKSELYEVCQTLNSKGVILVSAFDNYGSISYPAQYDCVVGVSESEKCRKNDDFISVDGSNIINVLANGNIQRCMWKEPLYQICGGNSFACAHITGIIGHKFLEIQQTYSGKVLEFIRCESFDKITLQDTKMNNKKLSFREKRAVIFPFNKENHSLFRFEHMLPFDIIDVYDTKYSGKVGAYTDDLLKINGRSNYLIKNIDNIDMDKFDLLILGHTKELERALNAIGFAKELIRKCLNDNKFVYSYDAYEEFEVKYENYYNPNAKWKEMYNSPIGKLYRSSTPVVGVFGTSSRQGKFTLQLILRERFIKDGYTVGQIASEPTGHLFQMDYCFPFGYGVECEITRNKMVSYLNFILHKLDNDNDIIMVGCQSSTLPYDNGNISDFTFTQIEFLFSTSPDCIVLCVNQFDSFDDIDRTIKFIEASVSTKVIALVVYPMKLKNINAGIYSEKIYMKEEEKEDCLKQLAAKFKKPVFILNENMDGLYNNILDFFD